MHLSNIGHGTFPAKTRISEPWWFLKKCFFLQQINKRPVNWCTSTHIWRHPNNLLVNFWFSSFVCECNFDQVVDSCVFFHSRKMCLHYDVIKWNHFHVTGPSWGESTGHCWIPSQRPVTRSFAVFFNLRLNKRLNKQSRRWWFGMPLHSLWRHCNCPACRTTLVATRFRVAVICPIIQVPHCIKVFFYFVWFVLINHIFQFYYELCTYCNILDIYLS